MPDQRYMSVSVGVGCADEETTYGVESGGSGRKARDGESRKTAGVSLVY